MNAKLQEFLKLREDAQRALEGMIRLAHPVGSEVTYAGIRGPQKGKVTDHDGEMIVIDGKIKRNFIKILD